MAAAGAQAAAPGAARADVLEPKNHYFRHQVICTCDERRQADRLGGHTWNIINNREDTEVYLRNIRNREHFIDESGNATSRWFQRKARVDLDGDGVIDCCQSSNVAEVMACPGTAGKEAARSRARQARQLCQAATPGDFAGYSARRARSAAPPTPGRISLGLVAHEPPAKPTPRTARRQQWTARRGEQRVEPRPPPEHEMFRTVDQLRTESHMDVVDQNFATSLNSARAGTLRGTLTGNGASAVSGAITARSMYVGREDHPAKPVAAMTRNSRHRIEASEAREISSWPIRQDKLQRQDPYYVKPVQQSGSSSVKYDIISNERRQFWY